MTSRPHLPSRPPAGVDARAPGVPRGHLPPLGLAVGNGGLAVVSDPPHRGWLLLKSDLRGHGRREACSLANASARMASPSASLRRSFTYAKCVLYGSLRGAAGGFCALRPAGKPQRGQSQISGSSASIANEGRDSCPFAHQYDTRRRGAASPRSDSPIGPAPTRVPRIALPLAIDRLTSRNCPGRAPSCSADLD